MTLSIAVVRWDVFMLVLVRVAAMVMVAPVLGSKPIPAQVKIGLSLLLAMLLTPLQASERPMAADGVAILLAVSRELVVGLLMGFAGVVVFSGIQMAAHLIGIQIGFGMSNTIDPLWPDTASFLDTFYNLLAMMVFLNLGGHHALLQALARSFELVPVGQYAPAPVVGDRLIALTSAAFAGALHLAMPAVGTVLLVDATMALVVRTIPQLNVFAVGMPVKLAVGMFALATLVPMTMLGLEGLSRSVAPAMARVLP